MKSLDATTVFKLNIYFIVYIKEYVYIYNIKMPHIFLAFQKKKKKSLPNQQQKLIKPIDPKFRATELKPCRPKKKKNRKGRWHCGTH